jgi:hypothetical protein
MATFTAGQVLTAGEMNALATRPAGRLYQNGTQSIASGTLTQITTSVTSQFLYGGMTQSGSGLVVPTSGAYLVSFSVSFNAGSYSGNYLAELQQNGSDIRDVDIAASGSSLSPTPCMSDLVLCSSGDTLTWWAFQASGSSIATDGAGTDVFLSAVLLSNT